ncbi:hypothetical protein [Azospirillum sp. B4]|uniref:hypothetical protein n=1 Tax=Azospirillum sp. B4 TaxID=95605 RepID=UPI00034B5165|nr:hypothetical protein [Azospirillum sp. B4]
MALDGVLSTVGLYSQGPGGIQGTSAYGSVDTSAGGATTATTSGGSAGTATPEEATSRLSAPAYISPVVTYDSQAAIAITQFRDSVTGAVDYQIPSRHVVEQYRLRAAGAPRYQGGNPLLPAEVGAPSNDQSATTGTAGKSDGGQGASTTGGTSGSATGSSASAASGGSGSAVISPTVAAVTLGAAAASVNVVA